MVAAPLGNAQPEKRPLQRGRSSRFELGAFMLGE
jgi:hypothetical protein